MLSFPGRVFAYAMNSAAVVAGNDGATSMTSAPRAMLATGARQVANKIKAEIIVKRGVDRIRRRREQQRMPVRHGVDHGLRTNVATCADAVLDDERLPQARRQRLTEQACEDVARSDLRQGMAQSSGPSVWDSLVPAPGGLAQAGPTRCPGETQEGSARYRHGSQSLQDIQCTRCNVATPDAPVDTVGFLHVSWSPLSVKARFCSAPSSFG